MKQTEKDNETENINNRHKAMKDIAYKKSHAGGQEDYEKLLKLIIREMQMSS